MLARPWKDGEACAAKTGLLDPHICKCAVKKLEKAAEALRAHPGKYIDAKPLEPVKLKEGEGPNPEI